MKDMLNIIGALSDYDAQDEEKQINQKEKEILHSLLNSLSQGVIVSDELGKFIYFNPSAQEILGIGARDMEISDWTTVYGCYYPDRVTPFPPEELPLAKAIRNDNVYSEIIYICNDKRPDGVFIDVSASAIKDSQGNIKGGTVIFDDVTQRELAEISRKQSEARMNRLFKGIPIPTYVWQKFEEDFVLVDYNDEADKMSDHQMQEFMGSKVSDIYKNHPEVQEGFRQSLLSEHERLTREIKYKMVSTGEVKDLIVHFVKIPPDMVLVHTVDVTEIKQKDGELRQLSSAVEQTADSVIITDKEGVIEYVNPAFKGTTGYTKEEVLGQNMSILKSDKHDSSFYNYFWETISNGNPYKGVIVNRKKEGTLYWSEQTITPMCNEKGEISHYVSVLRDITQLRKQQEQDVQIQLAREVQSQLFKSSITMDDLDISGSSIPATETNGDYYDIMHLNDGTYGIVIADVSGHGIGSAMIMAQTRAYLHAFAKHESDPGILLTQLNEELFKDLDETHFVTLVFIRIDPLCRQLIYANAGHLPGYLLDQSGKIKQEMESTGIPLGFLANYEYPNSAPIRLEEGDFFVLLTDGIAEAHDLERNEFGVEKALEVIQKNYDLPVGQIQKKLNKAVQEFSSGLSQEDDITSLICRFQPVAVYEDLPTDCRDHTLVESYQPRL